MTQAPFPQRPSHNPQLLRAPPASRNCLDLDALWQCLATPAALAPALKAARQGAITQLETAFDNSAPVAELVRAMAWVVEQLVLVAWTRIFPQGGLELIAVGGFGRGEMHPHSDTDLLILTAESGQADETGLTSLIQVLWDAGLHPGHSIRTPDECAREAEEDVTVATNLMEARLLAGTGQLYSAMQKATAPPLLWPADRFFAAKMHEQNERHAQFEDTVYNLEPNLKEGPGGLRDIQMIGWVTQRHFGTSTLFGLVEHGFLSEGELQDLISGRDRLWAIRWALHTAAGRAEERLLFEHQRALAERFGYGAEAASNAGVERFMQVYYRTVMQLERLNERLLQSFDEELLAGRAMLPSHALDPDFRVHHGYLEVIDEQAFVRHPELMMRLFLVMADHPDIKGVRGSTIRLVREHLYLIDESFRNDAGIQTMFMELLRKPRGVYTQLERMNRYGALAAFLPPFAQITGRMQFDLFHVYTVDQHTLFVIRNLRRFHYGKYGEVFTHADEVAQRIEHPEVLYLSALFHDIAKGRGGDHSQLGAADAQAFLQPLDMPAEDKRLVVWLVEQHLLMSRTAQREDIGDPEVITRFADAVGEQRYLDHLYVLTIADIAATSPKLWNSWKDSLLWDLYLATGHALRRGLEKPLNRALIIRETRSEALERLASTWPAARIEAVWQNLPERVFLRFDVDQLVWTTECVLAADGAPLVALRQVSNRGITEVFVHADDYDGLFAAIAREFDRMHIDVLAARVHTTDTPARSWDLFQVMDAHHRPLNHSDVCRLQAALSEQVQIDRIRPLPSRPIPRRLRPFMSRSEIAFAESPEATLLEVVSTDRPGLLSAVAEALVQADVRLIDARVATFGQRVEDTFLVTGLDGRPLDPSAQERLEAALRERLDND